MSTQGIASSDLAQLMQLLKEYTGKLRDICDSVRQNKFRRMQTAMLMAIGLMGGGAACAAVLLKQDFPFEMRSLMAVGIGGVMAIATVWWFATLRLRFLSPRSFDSEQVAATVERLVKLASQYQEHSVQRIGERFEFELRLAEAEGALRAYKRLTGEGNERSESRNESPSR
jgi:hypothetical protein